MTGCVAGLLEDRAAKAEIDAAMSVVDSELESFSMYPFR
jgi:hypothetical protein